MTENRPSLPPFTLETAIQKVQAAEDLWNTCDPERVSLGYTVDCEWRNRAEHVAGHDAIVAFLTRKWQREHDYVLRKGWPLLKPAVSSETLEVSPESPSPA